MGTPPKPPDTTDDLDASRAPFMEHLEELRTRILRALIAVGICAVGSYLAHDEIFHFLTGPLYDVMAEKGLGDRLVYRSLGGVFAFHMQTAGLGGLFFGMPFVLWQLWQFVGPGLYRRERGIVLPFVFASTVCFAGGALFAHAFVLRPTVDFLLDYSISEGPQRLMPDINIEEYLSFVVKLMLGFGFAFEMPTIAAFLAMVGVLTHRALIAVWRYAIVAIFIIAAILTPPDVISQLFMAVPLLLLYGVSIGVTYAITRRRERASQVSPPVSNDDKG